MSTKSLSRLRETFPAMFDEFFKPWNEWFDGNGLQTRTMTVPAVNITDEKDYYKVSLAVPGMKKEDFSIDVEGNMLTISAEQEESSEEKEKKFTRKEYSYSSFSRSFTLPEGVKQENIEAKYHDGVLSITLPKKEDRKTGQSKKVTVN